MVRRILSAALVFVLLVGCTMAATVTPVPPLRVPTSAPTEETPATPAAPEEPPRADVADWVPVRDEELAVQFARPEGWQPVEGGRRFEGEDGFLVVSAVDAPDTSLDEVAMGLVEHKLLPYGRAPIIEHGKVAGHPSRLVLPSADQPEGMAGEAALVVAYSDTADAAGTPYAYLVVYADRQHIRAIAETISFLPWAASADATPSPEDLSARARDLLGGLVRETGGEYGDVHQATFMWHTAVAPGDVRPVEVKGWRAVADEAAPTLHSGVNAYLYEQGLTADRYNVVTGTVVAATGYGNDDLVCLIAERTGQEEIPSYRLEVMCGPRPDVSSASPVTTREFEPQERAEMLEQLAAGNAAFGLELYRLLAGAEGNLFLSPYSIRQALAMAYEGARAETADEMAEVLRFPAERDDLHTAYAILAGELQARGEPQRQEGTAFELQEANALWAQAGYAFRQQFLDALESHYGAGMRAVDFRSPMAREAINAWVAEQTNGRIGDLLPPSAISSLTRLVLTNAIYYKASWLHPFDEAATTDRPFGLEGGGEVSVATMQQTVRLRHALSEDVTVVELPYVGGELVMTVLMPPQGGLSELEAGLDPERLQAILDRLERDSVALRMPRWRIESRFGLAEALGTLGMVRAFDRRSADLSGMDGTRELFISAVAHKAFVEVNEAGTEAAAATGVAIGVTSAPVAPVEISIDHPFLFLIRDRGTGTILFMGRVVQPAG